MQQNPPNKPTTIQQQHIYCFHYGCDIQDLHTIETCPNKKWNNVDIKYVNKYWILPISSNVILVEEIRSIYKEEILKTEKSPPTFQKMDTSKN